MWLTNDEKNDLMARYEPLLRHQVNTYMRFCPWQDKEDLLQEARCAFYRHALKVRSEAELLPCRKQIHNALFAYTRSMYIVSIPHRYFSEQCKHFSQVDQDCDSMLTDCISDSEVMLVLDQCSKRLPPLKRKVLELKTQGFRNSEIRKLLDLDHVMQVGRIMDQLHKELRSALREC